jgi:HTH-type transcriptional regulator/antitoxin HipB
MELKNIPTPGDQNNQITTLDQIIDQKYGEPGTVQREQWEQEFEAFRLGVILEQAAF